MIEELRRPHDLMAELMYGAGLRVTECVSLRIKDIDEANRQILIRDGKGACDRYTVLPLSIIPALRSPGRAGHSTAPEGPRERRRLRGSPVRLRRKSPTAARDLLWQYLFPASALSRDPVTGREVRHHLHETAVQKAVKRAAAQAGLKRGSAATP